MRLYNTIGIKILTASIAEPTALIKFEIFLHQPLVFIEFFENLLHR